MTRKELEIRACAVESAYSDNDIDKAAKYVMKLYKRNAEKKLYRFRPPKMREVDAIKNSQIYLCRPCMYEDNGDCEWIDDIEALVEYYRKINPGKYAPFKQQFTKEKYSEIAESLRNNLKYIRIQNRIRNMCLISCITDKMNDYMWENYALKSQGICLEYNFEEVLLAIDKLKIRFFPIRYVDNRKQLKDIQFGPIEYEMDPSDELMARKYILSCMTKERVPYAEESEWRVLCENIDESIEKGQLYDFIKPSKIYLGKNINKGNEFKTAIENVAKELEIPLIQM